MTQYRYPPCIQDCSTAERWVYRELDQAAEPLSVTELQHRTGLSVRGIRAATTELCERDVIEEQWEAEDPRRKLFATP